VEGVACVSLALDEDARVTRDLAGVDGVAGIESCPLSILDIDSPPLLPTFKISSKSFAWSCLGNSKRNFSAFLECNLYTLIKTALESSLALGDASSIPARRASQIGSNSLSINSQLSNISLIYS